MGDGEGSDPMSRAPIIITPPGRIPGTPILMSRPRHRQEGGPPCDFTGLPVRLDYPRGSPGLEWLPPPLFSDAGLRKYPSFSASRITRSAVLILAHPSAFCRCRAPAAL